MNIIDNIISVINPQAALKRQRSRLALSILNEQERKYEAAGRGRRANGWPTYDGSPNMETAIDLPALRARARHMIRNNAYASKAIKVIVNNTVGTGIVPQAVSSSEARVRRFKERWRLWAESKACDYYGRHNIYGLQRLAMRAVAESGECIILKRRTGEYKLQLQVLEADFLDHGKDVKELSNGGYITQGVEFDKEDNIKGYWIFNRHPGEYGNYDSKFRPADDVIHLYEMLRPGQVRGVPFGVSSLLRLKDFDDYEDAEVVRQKIAACFAAFVQDADPASSTGSGSDDDLLERLEPGVVEHLPPGKTISFANPPTTGNYDNFSRKILQGIAAGYGITYEAMTGDLSNVNFSSGRMGWIEMHRQIADWQWNMLVPMFCESVLDWFLDVSVIAAGFRKGDLQVIWTPPRREMIDPVKETNALNAQVRNGFMSWSEAVRGQGYEPDQVLDEMKSDAKKFDAAGLVLDSDPRQDKKVEQEKDQDGTPLEN
jgi:lambda family phage portal protein